jgi:hypothetical protein
LLICSIWNSALPTFDKSHKSQEFDFRVHLRERPFIVKDGDVADLFGRGTCDFLRGGRRWPTLLDQLAWMQKSSAVVFSGAAVDAAVGR